jgi:hypothetical protein
LNIVELRLYLSFVINLITEIKDDLISSLIYKNLLDEKDSMKFKSILLAPHVHQYQNRYTKYLEVGAKKKMHKKKDNAKEESAELNKEEEKTENAGEEANKENINQSNIIK